MTVHVWRVDVAMPSRPALSPNALVGTRAALPSPHVISALLRLNEDCTASPGALLANTAGIRCSCCALLPPASCCSQLRMRDHFALQRPPRL